MLYTMTVLNLRPYCFVTRRYIFKAVFILYHFDISDRFHVSLMRTKIGKMGPNLLILFIWTKIKGNIVNLITIDEAIRTAHHGSPTKLLVWIMISLMATIAGSIGSSQKGTWSKYFASKFIKRLYDNQKLCTNFWASSLAWYFAIVINELDCLIWIRPFW